MALWQSCDIYGLPRLQLFFLEENLSVNGVGTGGRGVRSGGGRGLWPGSDQLQFCICQALLLRRTRLEENTATSAFKEAKRGVIVFKIIASYE